MYAVIKTGGKQYLVSKGEIVKIEKLNADKGADVSFDDVLFVGGNGSVKVGDPVVKSAKVEAKVFSIGRDAKVKVFKKKRRKGYRRTKGHRQAHTKVKITNIIAE